MNIETSFSAKFPIESSAIVDVRQFFTQKIEEILIQEFHSRERRTILQRERDIAFACPICGDSHTDEYKKRGHLYIDTLTFYCFNCGAYRTAFDFFKQFGIIEHSLFKRIEKKENINVEVKNIIESKISLSSLPTRQSIMDYFHLLEIKDSAGYSYLTNRLQRELHFQNFAYSYKKHQIFIFNLIEDRVLGFQVRNIQTKDGPKYLTYSISNLYTKIPELFSLDSLEQLDFLKKITLLFRIGQVDISKKITILEGPFDAYLLPNSLALAGATMDYDFSHLDHQYMYDYDKTGRKKAAQHLQKGDTVFLWKKCLLDHGIEITNRKVDLTDFLLYCKNNRIKIKNLQQYFSNKLENSFDL